MQRSVPWLWLVLLGLLLLAPSPAGRLLLDVLGGLTLGLLLLPVLAAGGGWIAWQVLRRRLQTCPRCGSASFSQETCPLCGASMQEESEGMVVNLTDAPLEPQSRGIEREASTVTIDVVAQEVDDR
ncbi:hypothetical protein [Synechococcus sp. CS-1328]|uniref:hypothetical protein n=1 Tax=Synechococcus sp. CS-1328 TaxID=2847976 RepID=UPI00223B2504|nr:hypothetical protein [Synechococcus sp. CS-1328]MCT0225513.1 hypothetical protein [Synechococcus sp. CS-1328]